LKRWFQRFTKRWERRKAPRVCGYYFDAEVLP
jgi:hypothetical protein